MANINRKNINALRTYNDSYMQHNPIPDLTLNGSQPFTVEAYFSLLSDGSRGTLYRQEGVFELGVDEGTIYFDAPGFCSFQTTYPYDVKILPQYFYYAAVTYDGTAAALYLQGYQVLTQTKTGTGASNDHYYDIGCGHNGYITAIRVHDKVLPPEQILTNAANPLAASDDCVAWLDFSQRQPVDLSKNHLHIWTAENNADRRSAVVNLVACTSWDGSGCALLTNSLSAEPSAYSITGKVYPQRTQLPQMCLYSNRRDDKSSGFEILLQKTDDHNFKLVFVNGMASVVSQRELLPDQWGDFAVTVAQNQITLYVDGIQDNSGSGVRPLAGKETAVIGARTIDGRPDYTVGFRGYIDYIAEFTDVLDPAKINAYKDNPPFLFDPHIVSIMYLAQPYPQEIVYNRPVALVRNVQFVLAENTNPLDCEKGVSCYIPTEEDPMWATLTPDQQWQLETGSKLTDEVTRSVYGVQGAGVGGMWMLGTEGLRRRRGWRADLQDVAMEEVAQAQPVQIAAQTGRAGAMSFFSCGGITAGFATLLQSPAFWGIVAVSAGVAVVAALIIEQDQQRPAADGELQIVSLQFDHNADPAQGGIHFRTNQNSTPPSMDFSKGDNGQINMCGVFIPPLLTNPQLTVGVKFVSATGASLRCQLSARELDSSHPVLGHATSEEFTIANQETKTLNIGLSIADTVRNAFISKNSNTWQWSCRDLDNGSQSFVINSNHTVYTLPAPSQKPWNSAAGLYNAGDISYVWTDVIDILMEMIPAETTDVIAALTNAHNNSPSFIYDTAQGASFYTDDRRQVKMTKYLADRRSPTRKPLNCTDCANIVATLAAAAGFHGYTDLMLQYFQLNKIIPIGCDDKNPSWVVPFGGGFSYHEITLGDPVARQDIGIYDACLKIDHSPYPGQSDVTGKIPYLPVNYAYAETGSPKVNVPVTSPYNGEYYRERLVKDQETVNLYLMALEPAGISSEVTIMEGRNTVPSSLDEFKKRIRAQFGLDPFPISPRVARQDFEPDFSALSSVRNARLAEDIGPQKIWQISAADGREYTVDIHVAANQQGAGEVLVERLSKIMNPHIERNQPPVAGEISFIIAGQGVLFVRGNTVVHIFFGPQSLPLATELDRQMVNIIGP